MARIGFKHSVGCPEPIWEWAKNESGMENPGSFLRSMWIDSMNATNSRKLRAARMATRMPIPMPDGYETCLSDEGCEYHSEHKVIRGQWVGTPKT